jgi:hypothetical protein
VEFAGTNPIEQMIEMTYRNNDNITRNVYRYFETADVTDPKNKEVSKLEGGGGLDIEAGEIMTFKQNLLPPFDSPSGDSALFELKGYLDTGDLDHRKENDTVRFNQFFRNYYARDDGSPENGYGFRGYNAQGCAVACRYETFAATDTLRAVRIYFNPTADSISRLYRFKIAVWRDDNGRPGELAYLSTREYSPRTAGHFTQFNLVKTVIVTKYSPYWVGWVQVTSGFLNVGFDRNYNDKGNLWYNNGSWKQDINDGTLMIRPVLGKKLDVPTSVEDLPATMAHTRMTVFPNPASLKINIRLETLENTVLSDYHAEIYDLSGRLLYRAPFTGENIDVGGFEPGLYVVRLLHKRLGNVQSQKLMIER